jgi:uncharacterized protein (DUF608 family)
MDTSKSSHLFPIDTPLLAYQEFRAAGFSEPACGVIYHKKARPEQGMPLGGLDTGRIGLEADGTFGYCTIYNSICPEGGPLKIPFLGFTVGNQTWALCNPASSFGGFMFSGIQTPVDIRYWGHYPVVDLEYELPGSPVSAGLRTWAPFILGDAATSNTPGAVFEVHLRNLSQQPQDGRLAFSFPGPTQAEAQIEVHSPRQHLAEGSHPRNWPAWVPAAPEKTRAERQVVRGEFTGLVVTSQKVKSIGCAIGVVGEQEAWVGGPLSSPEHPGAVGAWGKIGTQLPEAGEYELGGSVSVGYQLEPGEEVTIRFVAAWYAPMWIGEGEHTFQHMYTRRYRNALDVAHFISHSHASLLQRTLSWQAVIYSEQAYPVWLREALVNILHLFPINSLWAAARPPIGPWCIPEEGLFGLLDGIVEDPAVEPIPDTFYANAPLVFFFPEAALSSLHGYKAYQFANGACVWIWGGIVGEAEGGYEVTAGAEFAMPTPGYQTTTNGPCFVDLIDRYIQRTGSRKAVIEEFYPAVKRNTLYTMSLRDEDGADGVISVPRGNINPTRPWGKEGFFLEWFEFIQFYGMTAHVGGIHLASLAMARRMAEAMGDTEFALKCQAWIEAGNASMEDKMWNDGYYLNYYEPATGRRSDLIFGYQLDGQWMARFHGLPGVFRTERVKTTLETIKRTCAALASTGAANLAQPDGSLAQGEGYGPNAYFTPELFMLASTYLYEGDREFGLELARRCLTNLTINVLSPWNHPNIIRGDTGERLFGSHYVQNMMLWVVPAALEGKDLAQFCAPGGLVDRILRAANPDKLT